MRQRQIEVLFDEQWYSATIVSYDSAFNAKVRYNDGTEEGQVSPSRIRTAALLSQERQDPTAMAGHSIQAPRVKETKSHCIQYETAASAQELRANEDRGAGRGSPSSLLTHGLQSAAEPTRHPPKRRRGSPKETNSQKQTNSCPVGGRSRGPSVCGLREADDALAVKVKVLG